EDDGVGREGLVVALVAAVLLAHRGGRRQALAEAGAELLDQRGGGRLLRQGGRGEGHRKSSSPAVIAFASDAEKGLRPCAMPDRPVAPVAGVAGARRSISTARGSGNVRMSLVGILLG